MPICVLIFSLNAKQGTETQMPQNHPFPPAFPTFGFVYIYFFLFCCKYSSYSSQDNKEWACLVLNCQSTDWFSNHSWYSDLSTTADILIHGYLLIKSQNRCDSFNCSWKENMPHPSPHFRLQPCLLTQTQEMHSALTFTTVCQTDSLNPRLGM